MWSHKDIKFSLSRYLFFLLLFSLNGRQRVVEWNFLTLCDDSVTGPMTRKVTQPRGLHFIEIFSLVKIFLGSRKYFTMTKLIQITLLFVSNSSRYWVLIYLLFFFSKPSLICLPPPYYWNEIFVENRGGGQSWKLFGLTTNTIEFEKKGQWCQLWV